MTRQRIGLYPGTFDPVTKGHYDIIKRAGKLVDKLVAGVAVNAGKGPLFSMEERVEMVRAEIGPLMPGATEFAVRPFSNLPTHFAMDRGSVMSIGGLPRSTESRVGKGGVSMSRYGRSAAHEKK